MKKYVLYHGNCPDGLGAALAAHMALGGKAECIPVNYGKPIPKIEDGAEVYIVDFSYPRADLVALAARTTLRVLDHHATAEKDLDGLPFCTFDIARSGAVMAWQYFFRDKATPMFFRYLQDRDLWQFKLPQSREVSAALGSYPFDLKVWVERYNLWEWERCKILVQEGTACLRLKTQQVLNMAKHQRVAELDGKYRTIAIRTPLPGYTPKFDLNYSYKEQMWTCPVANATVFFSEVGES